MSIALVRNPGEGTLYRGPQAPRSRSCRTPRRKEWSASCG